MDNKQKDQLKNESLCQEKQISIGLDKIKVGVNGLKTLALQIGNELDKQNQILDNKNKYT